MPPQASGYVKSRLRSLHGALSTGRGAPRQAETKPQPTAQPSVASYEQLPTDGRKRVVVVGLSMVGWKFIDKLVNLDRDSKKYEIVTFSEEPHVAYNRVGLTQLFEHENAEELHMAPPTWYEEAGVRVLLGHKAVRIDRDKRQVLSDNGAVVAYDELVLSTGSEPFVPPIPGADREGVSTYRDIKDVHSIVAQSKTCKSGAVIGGGLLGLESAKALYDLGVSDITIVEGAPRLMVRQLDEQGAKLLQKKVSELNIKTIVGGMTDEFYGDETGALAGMKLKDGTDIPAQMIIVCTGVKPRDELARECGLEVGERGGIVVDDRLQTADPHIYAIGEVACHRGMCYGLVAPGNVMADNLAANLTGGSELFIK
jgi:nitrite reductase (NADH) large subunit